MLFLILSFWTLALKLSTRCITEGRLTTTTEESVAAVDRSAASSMIRLVELVVTSAGGWPKLDWNWS